jgi:hypothetical protein
MSGLVLRNGEWIVEPDTNLANLELTTVDITDGSWSFVDINTDIKTQALEDGAVKITTNAISSGVVNKFVHASYYGARWYKKLTDADGTQLTLADDFIMIVLQQPLSSSNPAPFGFGCGFSIAPLATGSTTQDNQGWSAAAVFNDSAGGSSTGRDNEFVQNVFSGGGVIGNHALTHDSITRAVLSYNNKKGIISSTISNKDNAISRAMITFTGSVDLYVQVGFGTRYDSVTALEDAEHKQKIQYTIIKLSAEQ